MSRIPPISTPADGPGDTPSRGDLDALFAALFPARANPVIDSAHDGLALAAYNPDAALLLAKLSAQLLLETTWAGRPALRELAIQAVNRRLGCRYGWETRLPAARAAGLSDAQLDALADRRSSDAFDAEERLVLAYAEAVAGGAVDDALSADMAAAFGQRALVELAQIAAFWSFWALFIRAVRGDD